MVLMAVNNEHSNRGAITRIRLENFMTYDLLDVTPGPHLNMILGPNGTGKSSIVCCIIVGLAGDVSLTGRGGSPADFVKRGRDYCITQIELFNDRGNNFIIERKINITNRSQRKLEHKSEWKINDRSVPKANVQALTKKLNIKVDNLCQFLPQDSVTQFVKMNTCELLMNTLKAAGDNSLVEEHSKLVEFTKEIEGKKQALDQLEKSCKENEVNAKRLESEVQQLQEREKYIKLRKICFQKIHYAQYLEAVEQFDRAKEEFDKLKHDLSQEESSSEPFKRAADRYKRDHLNYKQLIEISGITVSTMTKNISKETNKIEDCKQACLEEFTKFKSKLEEEKLREQNLKIKHQELKASRDRYKETQDVDYTDELRSIESQIEEIKRGRMALNEEKSTLNDKLSYIVRKMDELKTESQLIQEIKQKKANLLRTRSTDAWQVMDWLAKNEDKFQQHVFMPLMCEINVRDPKFAKYVEHAIPRNELTAFVCQTVDDVKTLTRTLRETLNLKINVILAPDKTMREFENDAKSNRDLSNLGVRYYLKDLIEAPEPIMRYLCGSNNFHRIPVIENCSESNLKQLITMIPKFYANEEIYVMSRSRYDNQMITSRDHMKNPVHLIYSIDTQRINEFRQRFQQYQKDRQEADTNLKANLEKEDQLREKWQKNVDTHRQVKHKHDEKKRLQLYIKKLQQDIKQIEQEEIDINAERKILKISIEKINMQMMKHLDQLGIFNGDLLSFRKLNMLNLILCRLTERNQKLAYRKYKNSIKNTERLKENIRKAEVNLGKFESDMEAVREEAEKEIAGFRDGRLDAKTKRRFGLIEQNTVEDLKNRRDDLHMRIERIFNASNNSALSEFNRQNEEMKEKRIKIEDLRNSIHVIEGTRNKIKETWLPSVKEVIDVIDENYKKFMRKLCYDGQVRLDFDPTQPEDFSVYGISILVKYRDNEQLIPLSSTRQSGGERSVATMIYMLALQTKTTAPFRCVDEINQGMDKDNERKVFELLVQTADSSSSQYFLVSPKLLSDLPYSEKMKIHMTYNGPKLQIDWHKVLSY